MTDGYETKSRLGPLGPLAQLGGRAAAATLRPVAGAAGLTLRPVAGVAGLTLRPVAGVAGLTRRPLTGAAALTLRPLTGAAGIAAQAGRGVQRRAVERVLESPEIEQLPSAALDSAWTQAAIKDALATDGAKQLVASLFESGLFDEIVDRLLASDALWRLVDELASSPAVTDAITQQGLGFADQVGDVARARSRTADDWLERRARRLVAWRAKSRQSDGRQPKPANP